MCVMCSTSVPTLFQYFFYDHIPTFLYIFHEMFFITCICMVSLTEIDIDQILFLSSLDFKSSILKMHFLLLSS